MGLAAAHGALHLGLKAERAAAPQQAHRLKATELLSQREMEENHTSHILFEQASRTSALDVVTVAWYLVVGASRA